MQPINIAYNEYLITTDKAQLQPEALHKWLSEVSYWARHVPYEVVKTAFDNSFCIGALKDGKQVGFARLITDYATFAYLADVYVLEEHKGKGISKEIMRILFDLDWVKSLRRMMLATKDAHGLYRKVGFGNSKFPGRIMEITRPDIYGDTETRC